MLRISLLKKSTAASAAAVAAAAAAAAASAAATTAVAARLTALGSALRLRRCLASASSAASDAGARATSAPSSLLIRRIKDSQLHYPLRIATDPVVRASYIDHAGALSIPRLLEDLDAIAGRVAYSHCAAQDAMGSVDDALKFIRARLPIPLANAVPPSQAEPAALPTSASATTTDRHLMIVTASVDRLDLHRTPCVDGDAELVGRVTHVGTSSMEIEVSLRDLVPQRSAVHEPPYLSARFTMVARDRAMRRAIQVNPLALETPEEQKLFARGQELKTRKRISAETALEKKPPTADERLIIHDLWIRSNEAAAGSRSSGSEGAVVAMERTAVESVLTMQPQDRNMHNFIFGGYLMRIATELAITAGRLFVGAAQAPREPHFLGMDDINFRKPVPIGAVLVLRACVTYASKRTFLVRVTADVIATPCAAPGSTSAIARETTNVFHVILGVPVDCEDERNGTEPCRLPTLLPRTYDESMLYLDGKRRWETAKSAAKELNSLLYATWE